jgi:hypothetical protein
MDRDYDYGSARKHSYTEIPDADWEYEIKILEESSFTTRTSFSSVHSFYPIPSIFQRFPLNLFKSRSIKIGKSEILFFET